MPKEISAGLLMYRRRSEIELFLAHPGGPFWKNKDEWGIPKGHVEDGEELFQAACREFQEESGIIPAPPFFYVGVIQTSRRKKDVHCWAFEWNSPEDPAIKSNLTTIEFPPGSGKRIEIPEIDRAMFFTTEDARRKIHLYQYDLIDKFFLAYDKARGI